ncbi:pantoate--beta-alanine ligase [Microbacterium sp. ASV49]|uniref:Pantothenate synthetase n=1 Tax=Microbacterium candidum TaxID=3041922 RepID=A0ABT7MUZ4_9MICO|nr:pantoate--beta-alanine ligase [Microbacterium sp. ASV49]MDL9978255.1 pantoate--beta-alanine ligase [Microbacterium sp. ASV49]
MITTVDALRARLDSIRSARPDPASPADPASVSDPATLADPASASLADPASASLADPASAAASRGAGRVPRIAHISTLGALHEGHVDLVHRAKEIADVVVVTVFVNPLRFRGDAEFDAYPRSLEEDERLLESLGVDIVFAPDAAELLPHGRDTTKVSAGDRGLRYEGSRRATYFDAILTVEAILLNIVRPDVAVYGERDRQRVFLVRRMVQDLFLDVEIEAVPTVRSDDGVPVSKRLGILEDADRAAAAKLTSALDDAAANADRGVDACIAAAQSALMGDPRIRLEYLSVVDPDSFQSADENRTGPALVLIAGTIGGRRFVDSTEVVLG